MKFILHKKHPLIDEKHHPVWDEIYFIQISSINWWQNSSNIGWFMTLVSLYRESRLLSSVFGWFLNYVQESSKNGCFFLLTISSIFGSGIYLLAGREERSYTCLLRFTPRQKGQVHVRWPDRIILSMIDTSRTKHTADGRAASVRSMTQRASRVPTCMQKASSSSSLARQDRKGN